MDGIAARWAFFITVAPQLQALLLVGEAHAIVAVGHSILTGGTVQQVDVGRTVWGGPGAVLWQVTRPRWPPAHGTRLLQLAQTGNYAYWTISCRSTHHGALMGSIC